TGDAALCALRDKVVVEFAEDSPHMGAEVEIDLNDGRNMRVAHDAGIPQKDHAQQSRRLEGKFERLVEPALGTERCRTLSRLIGALERTSVTELMAACAARKG